MRAVTGSGYSLSPKGSRWDDARRRRSYEGSSIAALDGLLTWIPATAGAADGWSLKIGSDSGQAARVVQVYGLIVPPVRGGGFYIDRYAVLDRDGRFLAGFPSGGDGRSGAEGPEGDASEAWYPAKDVAGLARSAGMVFGQDQVDTPREVINRYPGLLDHPRLDAGLTYANTVISVPFGLFLIMGTLLNPPHPGDDLIFWFARFIALGGGALLVWFGVRDYPPILRRHRQRMKAKHPERFAPRNHLCSENSQT